MYGYELRFGRRARATDNVKTGKGRDRNRSGQETNGTESPTVSGGTIGKEGLLFLPDSFYVDVPVRKIIL